MKKFLLALALLLAPASAWAQCNGNFPANTVCGNLTGTPKAPHAYSLNLSAIVDPNSTINYGVSGSAQTTTGTISSGSKVLTIAAAGDFVNGQALLVNHAGAAAGVSAPTGLTVTPTGCGVYGAGCTTTYTYYVAACNSTGGYSAYTSVSTAAGPDSITKSASNRLSWSSPGTCFLIWRLIGGTTQFLASTSLTSFFDDWATIHTAPFWVNPTPPASPVNSWLNTTISTGGGSTTLNLVGTAGASVTGAYVQHDDTAAMNNWIAAINASCSGKWVITPNSTVSVINSLDPILCGGMEIDGNNATVVPAGAFSGGEGGILLFNGSGAGSGTGWCPFYSNVVSTTTTTGINTPYLAIFGEYATGFRQFISPISVYGGTTFTLRDACPDAFFDQTALFTIGGPSTVGNTVSVVVAAAGLPGTPITITYTIAGGDNTTSTAHGLAVAINANAAIAASGIRAWDNDDNIVNVGYPHWVFTPTLTAGATGSATNVKTTSTTNAAVSGLTLLENITVRNINGDGTNMVGGAGTFYALVYALDVAHSGFFNIRGKNFISGSTLSLYDGYGNTASDIYDNGGGNLGFSAIFFRGQTNLQTSNIKSENSQGFGVGYFNGSWNFGTDVSSIYSRDRGIKFGPVVQGGFSNIWSTSSGDTGIALTWGTAFVTLSNWKASGNGCAQSIFGNSEGLWFSDDFDANNTFYGGFSYGVCNPGVDNYDIAIFSSDTGNVFYGTQYGSLINVGGAVFH